jgi:O-acetyl-ADP-ribose deacetylase (regulator of RNase III)
VRSNVKGICIFEWQLLHPLQITKGTGNIMPVHYVSGDLFLNQHQAQAFAHGCNCWGVMGAGIAVRFKQQYPDMYVEYRRLCQARPRLFNPGDAFLWQERDLPAVFNLATQERPGPHATSWAIETALWNMSIQAKTADIRDIAIPRIGAGLGGLEWRTVRAMIEQVFETWPGSLFVHEQYLSP